MKFPIWSEDTIARRFALTHVLTLLMALGLFALYQAFGGVWSKEPLDRTGLLNEAGTIVRIIESVPTQEREALAGASGTNQYGVRWHAANDAVSKALNAAAHSSAKHGAVQDAMQEFFAGTHHATLTFSEDSTTPLPLDIADGQSKPARYALAVRFPDGSWLVFTDYTRSWGLPAWPRLMIRLVLLGIAILTVSALAARQVSRPVQELAEAVRRFGMNAQAPAIAGKGPREIRNVINVFNAMQAQIQKFVSYRTTMLAAISHDLRTPLTRIRLRGEYLEDPVQQARLFRDVDEMQTMVDGALAFFRDDAATEATTTFDLPRLLMTIANDYADQNIDVPYSGPTHAPCSGRPFALKRAFTNIIDNAIKYATPPEVVLVRTDTALVVTIRDLGLGIPPDAMECVFRPYYRVDKSRNRSTGGVGLGLTAAQAIVQGHGGDIVLENRPDRGLDVRVSLPISHQSDCDSLANIQTEPVQGPAVAATDLAKSL
jgi:signal transduction histidine kinase